jgi:hypothetical protein
MLADLDEALHASGIELCFAEMKDPVKDKLKRFGLFARLGESAFFPTMEAAVSSYLEAHPADRDATLALGASLRTVVSARPEPEGADPER